MDWILENKEWLFSGAGIVIITIVIRYFLKKRKGNGDAYDKNQSTQTMGKNIKTKDGNIIFIDNKQELKK